MLINKSHVRELIKSLAPSKRIGKGYYLALDAKIKRVVTASVESAKRFMTLTEGDIV